ncbi:hypothetical protein [Citrobacter pasteurii]
MENEKARREETLAKDNRILNMTDEVIIQPSNAMDGKFVTTSTDLLIKRLYVYQFSDR